MLQSAIEENRRGRYFSTPNKRLYEKFFQQAQEDVSKDPRERRAVFMPSDNQFEVSQTQNLEIFELLRLNQAYLDFVKQISLSFFPISQETLKGYSGTVPTQLCFSGLCSRQFRQFQWLSGLVNNSSLRGDNHGLDFISACSVRGVR